MSNDHKAPEKKLPEKKSLKKPIVTYGLVAIIATVGIIGGLLIWLILPEEPNLVIGNFTPMWQGPDPLNTMVPTDEDYISQILEGLFAHDVVSHNSEVKPNLAINKVWSADYLNLTCDLRQDVAFHDGTKFNAAAAKWNFDRIYNLLDLGVISLNSSIGDLWFFPDGVSIINETIILGEFTICFKLNRRYIPLPSLLASFTSYILSPASTPYDDFVPWGDPIIGTGPFIYEEYIHLEKLILASNRAYWGGKPKMNKLIYLIYFDKDALYNALSSGTVSMINGYCQFYHPFLSAFYYDEEAHEIIDTFRSNSSFVVQEGPASFYFSYLIMNNKLVPVQMRKAISYALNYSSIIQHVINGYGVRFKSPIPEGMRYSNITGIEYPYFNVSKARLTLKDSGWPGTSTLTPDYNISSGNEWELLVTNNTPLATYNFTYTLDDAVSLRLIPILANNLKQIGIDLEPVNISWTDIWDIYPGDLNRIELSVMAYNGPKFNDPSNIINIMYSHKARDQNYNQVNDSLVQQWMEEALEEPDENLRAQLYYNIQKRLTEEIYPTCYLFHKNHLNLYRSNVKGVQVHQFMSYYKSIYF